MQGEPSRFEAGEHRAVVRLYPDMIGGGGHVHNSQFMAIFERARFDLFRFLEAQNPEMPREPYPRYVVAALEQQFRRPVLPDDDMVVTTRIGHVGRSSCALEHRLLRGDEEAGSAKVSLVFTDGGGRPTEQPRGWIAAFRRAAAAAPARA